MSRFVAMIMELQSRSHGLDPGEIRPTPLPDDARLRASLWVELWREWKFDSAEPVGSSRLMELAVVQSAAGGSPREMIRALVHVLQSGRPRVRSALPFFLKQLRFVTDPYPAEPDVEDPGPAERFDAVRPIPADLSIAAATAILMLIRDTRLYTVEDRRRLREALGPREPGNEGWSYEDVFGDD